MLHRSSETLIQAAFRPLKPCDNVGIRRMTLFVNERGSCKPLLQTVERSHGVENAVTSPQEVPFRLGTGIRTVQKDSAHLEFRYCTARREVPPEPSVRAPSRATPSPSPR